MSKTMLRVKIGTLSVGGYQQVKRAPKDAYYRLVRGSPKVGDVFAVLENGQISVLYCDGLKPEIGLIVAKRL